MRTRLFYTHFHQDLSLLNCIGLFILYLYYVTGWPILYLYHYLCDRVAKQKVIQAELEEKLAESEGNLAAARTKSNVSISPQINPKKFAQHGFFGQRHCEKSISLIRKIHLSTIYGFQKSIFFTTMAFQKSSTFTPNCLPLAKVESVPVPGPAVQKQEGHGSVE